MQADVAEPHRRLLAHPEGAAEIEVALGFHRAGPHIDADGGGDRAQGHAGTGDQGLEQHVAGARPGPVATVDGPAGLRHHLDPIGGLHMGNPG